jgi:hypothetical protein
VEAGWCSGEVVGSLEGEKGVLSCPLEFLLQSLEELREGVGAEAAGVQLLQYNQQAIRAAGRGTQHIQILGRERKREKRSERRRVCECCSCCFVPLSPSLPFPSFLFVPVLW